MGPSGDSSVSLRAGKAGESWTEGAVAGRCIDKMRDRARRKAASSWEGDKPRDDQRRTGNGDPAASTSASPVRQRDVLTSPVHQRGVLTSLAGRRNVFTSPVGRRDVLTSLVGRRDVSAFPVGQLGGSTPLAVS